MKLHKQYLLVLFLLVINNSFACKCVEYEKGNIVEYGLKRYDMVFYGELIKRDTINHIYSFKIIELFKGIYTSIPIEGVSDGSDCGLFPDKKGLWIVYGSFNNDNKISLSMCSPTQSQDFGPGWPPPPKFKHDKFGKTIELTESDFQINYLEFKVESIRSFMYQLEKLRAYKLSQNKISENQKNTLYNKVVIISLIINTLFIIVIIFILAKKRFFSNKQITK